ncbi:uncharacterized protein [Arachis hypogaea]|uniref:uncharacterized protein n=1 Tax=Arachis hypogaea TaxID=3818 RepID=UPI003B20D4BE
MARDKRLLDPLHLKPVDRPDIVCRMFKMKLDMLIKDLKKERFFGKVVAEVHTIEFQKRGLPHAHILIFLDSLSKFPDPKDIDKVICAEIPNQFKHPDLYKAVKKFMLHGPCGSANIFSPYMKEGHCSKFYPKSFADSTTINTEGYPIYRRRMTGCYDEKGNVALDNRYVVPYNPSLLMKYPAHMNVEWCNQSRAIKYLFKYINKGYNRVTAILDNADDSECSNKVIDEIKNYLDCRYISPCEAVWRIFAYPIHSREPVVQRLSFHLAGQNPILYEDDLSLTDDQLKTRCLYEIEMILQDNRKILKNILICLFQNVLSQGMIVLTVALSGIAALLLPGDRTAHSRFAIPLRCMRILYSVEAVDKSLRDIMSSTDNNNANLPCGGKVVVFGGDFRQILPVIPGGGRTETVNSSICSSYIWDYCSVLRLTKNMRLEESSHADNDELTLFSQWILNVGDGNIGGPNYGISEIMIPTELLISNFEDPLSFIVDCIYPNLLENHLDFNWLQSRAIFCSTLDVVEKVNQYIIIKILGDEKIYLSSDSVDKSYGSGQYAIETLTEFLNSLQCSGLPHHALKLKVGISIMLLRNLDQFAGLCNGTTLIITRLSNHVIEAEVLVGSYLGKKVLIPRMCMSPSQSPWPFKLDRRQFPIVVSYAMTINKSQG